MSEHISTIFSKIEQKLTDLWFFFVAPNFIANCLNFMISNLFLEISLRKKLWIDFQNIGINLFINLYTFWIVYQKYPLRGGKGQKIWKTPFFHKSHAIGSPCAPPLVWYMNESLGYVYVILLFYWTYQYHFIQNRTKIDRSMIFFRSP